MAKAVAAAAVLPVVEAALPIPPRWFRERAVVLRRSLLATEGRLGWDSGRGYLYLWPLAATAVAAGAVPTTLSLSLFAALSPSCSLECPLAYT